MSDMIWNGSYTLGNSQETQITAGTGIKVTTPAAGQIQISNDQTVLWSGSTAVADNTTLTLSEAASNFEYIRIYGNAWSSNETTLWGERSGATGNSEIVATFLGASGAAIRFVQMLTILTGKSLEFNSTNQFSIQGTSVSTAALAGNTIVKKIVGVNRIAGGN